MYKVCSTPIDHTKINTAITPQWTMSHDKLEKQENIQLLTKFYLMKLIN